MKEVFFINFARLLNKDEIKKGTLSLQFMTGGTPDARGDVLSIADHNAQNEFRINSPAGEYGILYTSSATPNTESGVGHIYYQAGIAVLTASIFDGQFGPNDQNLETTASVDIILSGSNITASCDGIRNAWYNVQYNNTPIVTGKLDAVSTAIPA